MLYEGRFEPDTYGDFRSITYPGAPSPAYAVVQAARRRLEGGGPLPLPEGVTLDSIQNLTWFLGFYDPQRVSCRQATELAQIARELLKADGGNFLSPNQKKGAQALLATVEKATRNHG